MLDSSVDNESICNPGDLVRFLGQKFPWRSNRLPTPAIGYPLHLGLFFYTVIRLYMKVKVKSHSPVRPSATPWTTASQAPPSMGFSRQEYWSGVPLPSLLQCMKVKSQSEVTQSCSTLCDPMDCSLPGSSIHGIFQARVLEWGATAFSGYAY